MCGEESCWLDFPTSKDKITWLVQITLLSKNLEQLLAIVTFYYC